jgi:fructose-1,6-bisphosphatase/inositol monophosphatase family enzyme
MPDFRKILINAAKPAVSEIVAIQRNFLDGKGDIKYKRTEPDGSPTAPATIGDERSQAIYTKHFSDVLGAEHIYFRNEEEVSAEESRANALRKNTAKYRITIDPIDGTGNYSGQKANPAKGWSTDRKPVHRSLTELTPEEWASGAVRPGWGSMVAIQERQSDNSWKTVASSIYESNSKDTPGDLKGRFFVAEAGKKGVTIFNLQTGKEESAITSPAKNTPQLVIEGDFAKVDGAAEAQTAIRKHVTEKNNDLINFHCTAQCALGAMTGKAQGFFQGHPLLHDVLPIAHLAENAGLSVLVLDKKDAKEPAVWVNNGGKMEQEYPVFMAATPDLAISMAEKYIEGAGLDKDTVTFRSGAWEEKTFDNIKRDLVNRFKQTQLGRNAMPSFEEASVQAAEILSHKSEGPNNLIAYAVVNDTKKRNDGVEVPYYNPDSTAPAHLAYAFFETDRVGVPVVSAPGGTQDVVATKDGETFVIELTKEKSLIGALVKIGETDPQIKDVDALEKHTLTKFIEKGWDVTIEPKFVAAVREASEEQGINITSSASYIGTPKQFERMAMTKRTTQALEKEHGKLFDLSAAKDLGDVATLIHGVEEKVGKHTKGLRTPQMLFSVQVPDFDNVQLVNSGEKTETKIKGRDGKKYQERGTFATLESMEEQLQGAIATAQAEGANGNELARQEIIATYERLQAFKRIEAAIVKDLKTQGVAVTSSVPERLADTPDRELIEFSGQATASALPTVRNVQKSSAAAHKG